MVGKGRAAFETYYQHLFGADFPRMMQSSGQSLPVLLIRPDKQVHYDFEPVPWFPHAFYWPESVPFGTPILGVDKGWIYPLSASSLLPVVALQVKPGDTALDACAAPGGKTLALALNGATITANDISPDRMERLRRTVQHFGVGVQVEVRQQVVEIFARRTDKTFDKILIDAPCSSELHVYASEKHLAQWSYKRVQTLHKRQVQMILACLPLLNPGGRLVYSTCALTPEENEAVVDEVLGQVGDSFGLVNIDWQGLPGSSEKHMHRVWPHIDHLDPMFVVAFERKGV